MLYQIGHVPIGESPEMKPVDLIARSAGAEIGVLIQHREKHAGDIDAAYWMGYPSIEIALEAIADDLFDGRVSKIVIDGEALSDAELDGLTD